MQAACSAVQPWPGYMTIVLLSFAAAWGLAELMAVGWAFLIVAVVWGLAAAVLYLRGRDQLRKVHPKPEHTIDTLKEDVRWAKNQKPESRHRATSGFHDRDHRRDREQGRAVSNHRTSTRRGQQLGRRSQRSVSWDQPSPPATRRRRLLPR